MANALLEELDLAADADADAELELLPAELWADETAEEAEAAAEDTLLLADAATLETELLPFAAAREPRARRMSVRNCIVIWSVWSLFLWVKEGQFWVLWGASGWGETYWVVLRVVFVSLEMRVMS
jgi:hypothetical protein